MRTYPRIERGVTETGVARLIVEGAEKAVTKLSGIMLSGAECEALLREAWLPLTELYAYSGCAMLRRMISPRLVPEYTKFLGNVYELVLVELERHATLGLKTRLDELTAFLVQYARFKPLTTCERYAGTFGYETGKRAAWILGRPDDIGIVGVGASVTYSALRFDDVNRLMLPLYGVSPAELDAAS